MTVYRLTDRPIHLGRGATAEVEPAFAGEMSWYQGYEARHSGDGAEGRLVSSYTFDASWDVWEMHPDGAEVVLCVEGGITLVQETADGAQTQARLGPGEYAVNPPGVWHTADVDGRATCIFITAGRNTKHRPRR